MTTGLANEVVWQAPAPAGGDDAPIPFYLRDVWLAHVALGAFGGDLDAVDALIGNEFHDVRDGPRKHAVLDDLRARMAVAGTGLVRLAGLRDADEFDVAYEWFFELPAQCGNVYRTALCRNVARYLGGPDVYARGAPWDLMPAYVRGLLIGMLEAGEEVSRGRIEALLRAGRHALPGLLALATDGNLLKPGMPGEGWAPLHAARILGQMAVPAAVQPLIDLLGEEDVVIEEEVPPVLGKIGLPALNPLKALVDDPESDPLARLPAIQAMACLAVAHPEYRAAVVASYRALLQREDEDPHTIGKTALAVAQLRVHDLRDLVDEAYVEDRVDQDVIKAYDFDYAFTQKGGIAIGLAPAVQDVLRSYEAGEENLVTNLPKELEDLEWARITGAVLPPPPKLRTLLQRVVAPTGPRRAGKVGRNDPCPCGSGRKYKQCCLRGAG